MSRKSENRDLEAIFIMPTIETAYFYAQYINLSTVL